MKNNDAFESGYLQTAPFHSAFLLGYLPSPLSPLPSPLSRFFFLLVSASVAASSPTSPLLLLPSDAFELSTSLLPGAAVAVSVIFSAQLSRVGAPRRQPSLVPLVVFRQGEAHLHWARLVPRCIEQVLFP
uniref:Uncharacterized protein n=1 Tax=Kalanchoe fedtschenkoi TaxID=63787 RepID=A0A7N0TDP5_KALFE